MPADTPSPAELVAKMVAEHRDGSGPLLVLVDGERGRAELAELMHPHPGVPYTAIPLAPDQFERRHLLYEAIRDLVRYHQVRQERDARRASRGQPFRVVTADDPPEVIIMRADVAGDRGVFEAVFSALYGKPVPIALATADQLAHWRMLGPDAQMAYAKGLASEDRA